MASPKHIVFLCSRLDLPGGIERAIVNTANLLAKNGHSVTLLILDQTTQSFYPISPGVQVAQEYLHFGITAEGNAVTKKIMLLRHISRLRKKLIELAPHMVLCSEYPFSIAGYLAMRKTEAKIFAWEHHHFHHLERSYFWQILFKRIYPRLDGVICLNENEKKSFDAVGCKTWVIPNFIERQRKSSSGSKTLLTIGWLTKLKGVDSIPAIAEKVFSKRPDWNWKIIGSGPEEGWLKEELTKKSLTTYVTVFSPATPELSTLYGDCSCYVMTSRVECFPMVLLEAMSFGIPCVAFDCPTGPSAIIRNNEDGYLVEQNDTAAMASRIMELMENSEKRSTFSNNAYKNIERFSPARVYGLWEKLIAERT